MCPNIKMLVFVLALTNAEKTKLVYVSYKKSMRLYTYHTFDVLLRHPYPKLSVAELDPPSGTALCKMLSGEDGKNKTVTLSCGSGKISKVRCVFLLILLKFKYILVHDSFCATSNSAFAQFGINVTITQDFSYTELRAMPFT